jgi:alkaline phosphatase
MEDDFGMDDKAPLTGRKTCSSFFGSSRRTTIIVAVAAVLAVVTAALILSIVFLRGVWPRGLSFGKFFFVVHRLPQRSERPFSLIVMLSDGMGPASVSMARAFRNASSLGDRLRLDDLLVGAVQTASLNNRITDSAAGATAYACGVRNWNDQVGVFYDSRPCGTLLEAAKVAGKKIGIVAKSTVSNASPAAFTSHAAHRATEQFIASQQIILGLDVIFGGGYDTYAFRYGGKPSPLEVAPTLGFSIVTTADEMMALKKTPALGLFAPGCERSSFSFFLSFFLLLYLFLWK